jgi:thioredoxin-like negative regulator of GroEL
LERVYIDCEQLQEICAQHGVFSLPVVQVFFMGQKFIEEMRGFSLMG